MSSLRAHEPPKLFMNSTALTGCAIKQEIIELEKYKKLTIQPKVQTSLLYASNVIGSPT